MDWSLLSSVLGTAWGMRLTSVSSQLSPEGPVCCLLSVGCSGVLYRLLKLDKFVWSSLDTSLLFCLTSLFISPMTGAWPFYTHMGVEERRMWRPNTDRGWVSGRSSKWSLWWKKCVCVSPYMCVGGSAHADMRACMFVCTCVEVRGQLVEALSFYYVSFGE